MDEVDKLELKQLKEDLVFDQEFASIVRKDTSLKMKNK